MFITVVCKQYRDVLSFVRTEFHGCLMTWVPLWHYWARFWRFVTREWTLQCTICGFVNSAEYHITWGVSLRSVTALSADCYLTSSKNTSLTVYFSAVALLHAHRLQNITEWFQRRLDGLFVYNNHSTVYWSTTLYQEYWQTDYELEVKVDGAEIWKSFWHIFCASSRNGTSAQCCVVVKQKEPHIVSLFCNTEPIIMA